MRHPLDNARRLNEPAFASTRGASLRDRALLVADIAAGEAITVDRDCRFPELAIAAAKRNKLLGLIVPTELGGEGASLSDVAEVCFTIGRSCASSGMIVAMHYAALACVARHLGDSPWHERLLRRVAAQNLLLASSTTEGEAGGSVRKSVASLISEGGMVSLDRAATVVSYGAEADGIVTTARRNPDSVASDQALAVFLREDYNLVPTSSWQTLGMRGTCSAGFMLKARAPAEQVLPVPYKVIHSQSMVPVSHLLWCSVWTGIASAAVMQSQNFMRHAARRSEGIMPPGIPFHTKALSSLTGLRARLESALSVFETISEDAVQLEAIEAQTQFNLLKVEISEGALVTVSMAMRACGLAGYREDGDFSVGRHLRDILSAPIMIHNERILSNVAASALLSPAASAIKG